MVIFGNMLRKNNIKIYTKTDNFSKFSQRSILLNPFAMQYIHCTPLLNPVMHAHLSLFESRQIYVIKGPLFPILKRSTSIHKNNPALVVSIVLLKHYFPGICAFSKKRKQ